MKVRFLSAGDRALVVEFGDRVDRALSERRAAPRCDHPFERARRGGRDGPDLPLADGPLRSAG